MEQILDRKLIVDMPFSSLYYRLFLTNNVTHFNRWPTPLNRFSFSISSNRLSDVLCRRVVSFLLNPFSVPTVSVLLDDRSELPDARTELSDSRIGVAGDCIELAEDRNECPSPWK